MSLKLSLIINLFKIYNILYKTYTYVFLYLVFRRESAENKFIYSDLVNKK